MDNEKLRHTAKLTAADWDKTTDRAEHLMAGHKFGCSEALLLAFQEILGTNLLPPAAVAMSGSFRGGMGGAGCACGALAAGQMVLGAVFGYYGDAEGRQEPETVKQARDLYREFHDRFREVNGASCCRSLTKGLALEAPERRARCTEIVRAAAALTGGLIAREAGTAK